MNYEMGEIIYWVYLFFLVALLLMVTVRGKEFFLFKSYPMFSTYHGGNEFSRGYKLMIVTQNKEVKQWKCSILSTGKFLPQFTFQLVHHFEKCSSQKKIELQKRINIILKSIISDFSNEIIRGVILIEYQMSNDERNKREQNVSKELVIELLNLAPLTWKIQS